MLGITSSMFGLKKIINRKLAYLKLIACLVLTISAVASGSKLVEVGMREPNDLRILMRNGFDITYLADGQMVEVVLHNEAERIRLDDLGFRYIVIHEDLEQFLARRLEPNRDDMGGYMTLDEIEEEMINLSEDFPDIIGEPISFGETIEGRDIWAIKVSDFPEEDEEDEPEVLYTALLHAREVITPLILFGVIRTLAEGYEEDDRITELVDERQMWFIPCHNPDGYFHNEEIEPDGGGMWRKNRRENEDGSIGVDLNRNFGDHWGFDDIGSSPRGGDQTYRGTAPFSEPETQAVREFINDHNFRFSIYFHSYSNLCLYPIGYDYLQPPDRDLFTAMSERMTVENNYLPGTGWEVIYLTNGDSDDWLYASDEHEKIYAYTMEVGSRDDYFWPPLNRVEALVSENIETCLVVAEYADMPERVLRPPAPTNVTLRIEGDGAPIIRWDVPEDDFNPPVSFKVKVRLPDDIFYDNDPNAGRWEMVNTSASRVSVHSGSHSYRLAMRTAPMAAFALKEEIVAPETIYAWMNHNLSRNVGHFVALEVSYDGYDWEPLPGEDTEDLVMNDHNLGPGVTGDSNGWYRTSWDLGDHEGNMLRLRFRHYAFGRHLNGELTYIDDIGPFREFEWSEIVAEDLEDQIWIDEENDFDEELEYLVQAVDVDGDVSFWSAPAVVERIIPPRVILLPLGWSLISVPFGPDPLDLEELFANWLDRDILALVKNGSGRFFSPRNEFNNIGEWDPLEGYWIKLEAPDTFFVEGDYIPTDTPLPLVEGWNTISYLPLNPMSAEDAWQSISENLVLAKDGFGRFWVTEYDFNNLGSLSLGWGYYILTVEADTLIYPVEEQFDIHQISSRPTFAGDFIPPGPDNHSLLMLFETSPGQGEIILIDREGNTSGVVEVSEGQTAVGLAAWGEIENGLPGLKRQEAFTLRWKAVGSKDDRLLSFSMIDGDDRYRPDGFSVFSVSAEEDYLIPSEYGNLTAFPNPFNGAQRLNFSLDEPVHVSLSVYDLTGRLVHTVVNEKMEVGQHSVFWDGSNEPSGLYIAKLEVRSSEYRRRQWTKLIKIR